MRKIPTYMAIATKNNKYTVGTATTHNGVKLVGNIRKFDTFEEADECAKRVARGDFDYYYPGRYVSNR